MESGQGLLTLNGTKWSQHRKLLTPEFHYNVLKSYMALMSDSVNVLLDKWEKASMQRTSVEVFQDISLMTLDNIMKCAFSSSTACQTQSNPDYYSRAVHELSCLVSKRIQALPYGDAFYGWNRQGCKFQDACKLAYAHTDKIIKKVIALQ